MGGQVGRGGQLEQAQDPVPVGAAQPIAVPAGGRISGL